MVARCCRIIAGLGDNFEAGTVNQDLNLAELTVNQRLMAVVSERVAGSSLFSQTGIAFFDAIGGVLGVKCAAGGNCIPGQQIVIGKKRNVEATDIALAPTG